MPAGQPAKSGIRTSGFSRKASLPRCVVSLRRLRLVDAAVDADAAYADDRAVDVHQVAPSVHHRGIGLVRRPKRPVEVLPSKRQIGRSDVGSQGARAAFVLIAGLAICPQLLAG